MGGCDTTIISHYFRNEMVMIESARRGQEGFLYRGERVCVVYYQYYHPPLLPPSFICMPPQARTRERWW